jgi:putative ABC transport system permease protein
MTLFASVTPGYFGAMAIPLVAGRDFSADDLAREAPVVVVSRAAAERFWSGEDPIGSHVTLGSDKPLEVVGVVGDIRRKSLDAVPEPMVYVPLYMLPVPFSHLVLRGAEPAVLVSAARAAVHGLDAELPFGPADTLEDVRQRAAAQPRFRALLLALFAALAVALAVVGLYGVMSETVSQRRRELGVRLALGARGADLVRMLVGDGLRLALLGLAIGGPAALLLGRVLRSLLFDVAAEDPATLSAVSGILVAAGLLACWLPARRATRVDPQEVLRAE